MSFVSATFIVFLLIVCIVYFMVPKRMQWVVLLIGSYVFYLFSGIKLSIFLILTTITTFYTGKYIGKLNQITADYITQNKKTLSRDEKKQYKYLQTKKKKRVLLGAVIINLGILAVLKYSNFGIVNINLLLGKFTDNELPRLNWLIPLGISFYTLQSLSYIIDVYREKYKPDTNIAKYALFVSYFPQIIQGPIGRHDDLAHQFFESHKFEYKRFTMGAQLILWGFIKKLVIADRISVLVSQVFDNYTEYSGIVLFIAAAGYGFQTYADFSGGMDMARGISQIFGIELSLNFKRPYFATSVENFWRRWHITLGSWMREYIFYPLSLSKAFSKLGKKTRKIFGNYIGKKVPIFVSMFVVFLLVGLWHGAEWKYIAYGVWNGIIIVSSILLESTYKKMAEKLRINTQCMGWKIIQMLRTFILCSLGRFFSRGGSFMAALTMMKRTFTQVDFSVVKDGTLLNLGLTKMDYCIVFVMIILLFVIGVAQEKDIKIRELISQKNIMIRWSIYFAAILVLLIWGMYGSGYSANEFIYQQF